ncbi:MAG TPA: TonB-dependent receptor [Candidatus Limnocylindrales bacterium]|nr:TonB-dependent receptor [Candidatus Limnocylindrales bacterium]
MKGFQICLCIILASVMSSLAGAQEFRGSLIGEVQDSAGGRIASAKITIRATESSFERQVTADSQGEFRINDLLPGEYHLAVDYPGFSEARSDVTVVVSSVKDILVTLKPAPVSQTVNVQAEASSITTQQIDASSTVNQGIVTVHDLESVPLAHRSFANIAFMTPGTEPVEPSDPTKARITAVSFGGSSGLNDVLSVDGADNSDDYIGGFLQNFSPDAIQEFAVRTSQEDADTGRTVGGSVVITTKRGSNIWHGDAAFYERDAALNARFPIDNPAPNPKQPFSRQNYVGTLGGPIVTDKLWTYTSFEYVPETASIAYSNASLAQFNALASLASQGLIPGVNSIAVPSSTSVPFHDFLGSERLDWAQSNRSQWFLRVSGDTYITGNDLVQQGSLPSTGATSHSNYLNAVVSQQYTFGPNWVATFTFGASLLHHTETRNSDFGFALAFPFTSTSSTISGLETFGDNQFVTGITNFPVLRNQEKYQFRYDVSHSFAHHALRFGVDIIHEPVLSGALTGNPEIFTTFAMNPTDYLGNQSQFAADFECSGAGGLAITPGTSCTNTPLSNGGFSQNVQRLGLYAEDSWRVTSHLTVNYGLRYDTTFGLFNASGHSQLANPALAFLPQLPFSTTSTTPNDDHLQFGPRLGIAYSPGDSEKTVIRAGIGLYYNDLAQTGWVAALQSVNGGPSSGAASLIDPNYKTPYALHATAGLEHAFNSNWLISASFIHEQGVHAFRHYQYNVIPVPSDPNVSSLAVFRTDNRSRYDALLLRLQGNVTHRFNLVLNYTLASADTWGCVLGELFDYVNGVCNPQNAFASGDYGPSGEDVRHRAVLAGTYYAPAGFELTTLTQVESARPFTITTPVGTRAVINGVETTLDEFRGAPYFQVDLRVSRPIKLQDRWTIYPFIEFFNLFNRSNPGANYVTNLAALPMPVNNLANATAFCLNAACTQTQAITSLNQLRFPAGALGDFFGPGTTVGVPFAAQLGVRLSF